MTEKLVSKLVKCNLRGLLLSKANGVLVKDLLLEYKHVLDEELDIEDMGFSSILEFLNAVPDVARVISRNKEIRVLGIALNNLNITARKNALNSLSHNSNPIKRHKMETPRKQYPKKDLLKIPESLAPSIETSGLCDENTLYDIRLKKQLIARDNDNVSSFNVNRLNFGGKSKRIGTVPVRPSIKDRLSITVDTNLVRDHGRNDRMVSIKDELVDSTDHVSETDNFTDSFPKSMSYKSLISVYRIVCPNASLPLTIYFPQHIEVIVTHLEPQHENHFWGIILHPFSPYIDKVLSLDKERQNFRRFTGQPRAVAFYNDYHSRVWVKSVDRNTAEVFMVDFGNYLTVPLNNLYDAPNYIWDQPPLAIPFRHDANKDYNIKGNLNKRFRCWRLDIHSHVFDVSHMELIISSDSDRKV